MNARALALTLAIDDLSPSDLETLSRDELRDLNADLHRLQTQTRERLTGGPSPVAILTSRIHPGDRHYA